MITTELAPALTQNAITVLEKRCLARDEEGRVVETPEELFRRVARHVAAADALYGNGESGVADTEREFYELMASLDFLPNSPTLMNAGLKLGQLSACFVLPVGDSMEEIFDAVKYAAIIHKSGGGTGFSFSNLRPKGDVVGTTGGVSSGPITFMAPFDAATETVKQGSKRRGANMGIMRVDHPDILEFIRCKDNSEKLNNFNISVGLTDAFMEAVEEDEEFNLINPRTTKAVSRLRAKAVFDTIVKQAWKNGEPGIVFIDRINATNPTPGIGEIESTNPCGEQPLLPYESCNLGSINLAAMAQDGEVDRNKLKRTVWKAVHFLDNVIDVNKYPLKIIEDVTKANRKIGLGMMGWADMLIQLGIPYNSDRAVELADELMGFIQAEARQASCALAGERGVFPNYEQSIYRDEIQLRNATVTTIAPTGSLSIIAGCSSGIEPLFAVSFVRNVLEGARMIEVNPCFKKMMEDLGLYSDSLIESIAETGSIRGFDEIPEDIRRVFVTAHDLAPDDHVRMQAAFQKNVDNAVSKTVNLPKTATTEDVASTYIQAYKSGCKGVTIYRDGTRENQVLSTTKSSETASTSRVRAILPKKRPSEIIGTTKLLKTGCGNLYVTINQDESGQPFEVFTNIGKAGGCASSQAEAIGRLISLSLRSNIDPKEITMQLIGISCHQPAWGSNGRVLSCSDAIAKALDNFQPVEQILKETVPINMDERHTLPMHIGACPECGGAVEHEGGCAICRNCGFTKC